jgi:hypothetical protein
MTLVRALHGRAAMAGDGAPWPAMGELVGEGRRGGDGWGAIGGGSVRLFFGLISLCCGEEKKEKRKRKEKKK